MSYSEILKQAFRGRFELGLRDAVMRAMELEYPKLIGAHHFAPVSTEALQLYCGGYFFGAISLAQSVLEALVKFVAGRSGTRDKGQTAQIIRSLVQSKIISPEAETLALKVIGDRNDFHHLKPSVGSIDLSERARDCIRGLLFLEEEIFGGNLEDGRFAPRNPKFYDHVENGRVIAYLRQLDV